MRSKRALPLRLQGPVDPVKPGPLPEEGLGGKPGEGDFLLRPQGSLKGRGQVPGHPLPRPEGHEEGRVVGGEAVLLARGQGEGEGLEEGQDPLEGKLLVPLEVFHELVQVHHGVAVEGGGVELHVPHHPRPRVLLGVQVVHGGVEVKLPVHLVGA